VEDRGTDNGGDDQEENKSSSDKSKNSKPCAGNPQGVTRLFLGNLPFAVDETSLKTFLPGVTHIKWITDKETGKFYGSAFIEMETSSNAADAVAKAGQQLMGRPMKINFAPARPGDIWPPPSKEASTSGEGGSGGQAGGSGIKAMSAKPDNCVKLFIGNLSYDIDDDGIKKFFAGVDAEIKAVRWLHHKESGDFKGWYVLRCFKLWSLLLLSNLRGPYFYFLIFMYFFTFKWLC
jgi:nucleolin